MIGYQFTHGGFGVIPFGHRPLEAKRFTPAAFFSNQGRMINVALSFPEQQFETELQARQYAERRAKQLIDADQVPSDIG
jgi:hypothetical protein